MKKFDVELTKQDYVSGLTTVITQLGLRDGRRNRVILEQIGAWALMLILLLFVFPSAGLAVVVTMVVVSVITSVLASRTARQSSGASYDPATATFTAEFGDAGVVERTAHRVREWQWPAVRQVHDNGAVLVLELAGWDMLILPYRLWPNEAERLEFLQWARAHLSTPQPEAKPAATLTELFGRDQLFIGAIAAGVDAMFVAVTFVPAAYAETGIWVTIVGLLIAAAIGYLAYRIALYLLPKLRARSPSVAAWTSRLLVAALPIYIVVAYLRSL